MIKRILLFGIVTILITGPLSTQAAVPQSSVALEPWTNMIIDQSDSVYLGQYISIDHYERTSRAYISYYDETHGDLKLAYQVSAGTGNCGNTNWICETIDDSTDDVGKFSSIDVIDARLLPLTSEGEVNQLLIDQYYAKIGISYYDDTNNALKFALRTCTLYSESPCKWTITQIDFDGALFSLDDLGQYTSFKFDSLGTPTIFYHGQSSKDGFFHGYVKRAILTGTVTGKCDDGWECEIIAKSDVDRTYGTHISADGDSVAFYDGADDRLVLASPSRKPVSTCGSLNNWDCKVIDNIGDVGRFVSLINTEEYLTQMAYYDASNGKVKYAIQTSPGEGTCASGNYKCFAVDTIGVANVDTGIGLSLALDLEGAPIIAYQDFSKPLSPDTLKLARPSSAYNLPAGNCGEIPPGYGSLYWQCILLDGSGLFRNEAGYTAVSVNPAGLATVAFYETYNMQPFNRGSLKVAQQQFVVQLPLIMK